MKAEKFHYIVLYKIKMKVVVPFFHSLSMFFNGNLLQIMVDSSRSFTMRNLATCHRVPWNGTINFSKSIQWRSGNRMFFFSFWLSFSLIFYREKNIIFQVLKFYDSLWKKNSDFHLQTTIRFWWWKVGKWVCS